MHLLKKLFFCTDTYPIQLFMMDDKELDILKGCKYLSTECNIPEDLSLQQHHCHNLKSHKLTLV